MAFMYDCFEIHFKLNEVLQLANYYRFSQTKKCLLFIDATKPYWLMPPTKGVWRPKLGQLKRVSYYGFR